MSRLLIVGALVFVVGCGGSIGVNDQDGGGGGTGTGGGNGTGGGSGNGGGTGTGGGSSSGDFAGLNCDVANLMASKCTSCHGRPLTGGAPFSLLSRADLIAASPSYPGKTIAERSLVRMQATSAPMPPLPAAPATAIEISAFNTWLTAGTPDQTCGMVPDAGMGNPDAGPAPTTCISGVKWTFGNAGSTHMNPGQACRACHQQQEPFRAYFFMGTAYPSTHEQNNCESMPPSGLVVDIIDANGAVAQSLPVRYPSGNFYSNSVSTSIAMPYKARIRDAQGRSLTMNTPQTNGDCNTCHTEQGANGAPGRITWPQ
jgi:cytochrome c553